MLLCLALALRFTIIGADYVVKTSDKKRLTHYIFLLYCRDIDYFLVLAVFKTVFHFWP